MLYIVTAPRDSVGRSSRSGKRADPQNYYAETHGLEPALLLMVLAIAPAKFCTGPLPSAAAASVAGGVRHKEPPAPQSFGACRQLNPTAQSFYVGVGTRCNSGVDS